MNSDTKNQMKRIKAGLTLSALLAFPLSLCAADSTFTLHLTDSPTWNTAPWVLVSGTDMIPGAGDDILDISTSGAQNLYLNGNQEVRSLTTTSNNSFRLYNANESGISSTLTVSGGMNIRNGYTYIRSLDDTARFTVTTSSLTLGSTSGGSTGILEFGANANYRNVTFSVTGSTVLTGNNPAVILGSGLTAADTNIDLGHVSFDNNTGGSIQIGSGVLKVASLRNNGGENGIGDNGTAGILLLDGDAGDPNQPVGDNDFGLQIYGGVRVEKTGSNTQIFSRAGGNTYTGGTLITNGVLVIANVQDTSGIGRGAVEISDEGTLAGSGHVKLTNAAVTVKDGGNIAPGADGVVGFNKLTFNGENKGSSPLLDMQEGANFTFDLNAAGLGDSIVFELYEAGGLSLDSGGIAVNVNGALAEDVTYTLFTFYSGYEGSGKVLSGLTSGLVMGTGFSGYDATFHYDEIDFGGLGVISMTVQVVPEPGVLSLVLVAFGLAAMRRRRQ